MRVGGFVSLLSLGSAISNFENTGVVLDGASSNSNVMTAEINLNGAVQSFEEDSVVSIDSVGAVLSDSNVVFEDSPTSLVQTQGIMKGVVGVAGAAVAIASGGTAGLVGLAQAMLSMASTKYVTLIDDEYPYACLCSSIFPTQCRTPDDTESIYYCISPGSAASTSFTGGLLATAAVTAYMMLKN